MRSLGEVKGSRPARREDLPVVVKSSSGAPFLRAMINDHSMLSVRARSALRSKRELRTFGFCACEGFFLGTKLMLKCGILLGWVQLSVHVILQGLGL